MSKAKARKAIKAKATGKATKATIRTPAPKAAKHIPSRPRHVKHAGIAPPAKLAPPEAEVVPQTIKWSAAELKQFRARLQQLHDATVDTIGFLGRGHLSNPDDSNRQDKEEDGTEIFAQELSLMQVTNKQETLNKIIDAFHRLDRKTYGLCGQCGKLISAARLRYQPFAIMCITCQAAAEANRPRSQGFRKAMVQMVESEPS